MTAFIPEPVGLAHTYEFIPSFGGPIKRDKLWFYFTYKLLGHQELHLAARRHPGVAAALAELQHGDAGPTWQATSATRFASMSTSN